MASLTGGLSRSSDVGRPASASLGVASGGAVALGAAEPTASVPGEPGDAGGGCPLAQLSRPHRFFLPHRFGPMKAQRGWGPHRFFRFFPTVLARWFGRLPWFLKNPHVPDY